MQQQQKEVEELRNKYLEFEKKLNQLETQQKKDYKNLVYYDHLIKEQISFDNINTLLYQLDLYNQNQDPNKDSHVHQQISNLLKLCEKILQTLKKDEHLESSSQQIQNTKLDTKDEQVEKLLNNYRDLQIENTKNTEAILSLNQKQEIILNQNQDFEKQYKQTTDKIQLQIQEQKKLENSLLDYKKQTQKTLDQLQETIAKNKESCLQECDKKITDKVQSEQKSLQQKISQVEIQKESLMNTVEQKIQQMGSQIKAQLMEAVLTNSDLEKKFQQYVQNQQSIPTNELQVNQIKQELMYHTERMNTEFKQIEDAFKLIFPKLGPLETNINLTYDQLQVGLVTMAQIKQEYSDKFKKIDETLNEFLQFKANLLQQQNEQNRHLIRITRNVNVMQQEMNVFIGSIKIPNEIIQSQQIIEQRTLYYQKEHPDLNRLAKVQQTINQLYNISCRSRSASGRYQLFIKEKQSNQELMRNYGIRSSEQKKLLSKECNGFRQARGDGNCFYTSFGFQYLTILLNSDGFQEFINQMDKIIEFKLNCGKDFQITDNLCWEEFKYRLIFLKQIPDSETRMEELVLHFSAYEQSPDYPLIDGCFYALSTIFFRNLANYVIDHSEMKQQVLDQYNLLIWEVECNSNEIVITELAKYLKVHIKLLFFENGSFLINNYCQENSHQIILLMQPGHYNIGYFEKQDDYQQ